MQNVTGHHAATNLDNKIKSCCSVDGRFIFWNLTIIASTLPCSFRWWSSKQYHNNVFYAGQRGNYLCTQQCFLICQSIWLADMTYFYVCVAMVLDYNGPIIQIFKSMSLMQKQTAQNNFGFAKYMLLIISTTKRGSEHTNSQYFLAWNVSLHGHIC